MKLFGRKTTLATLAVFGAVSLSQVILETSADARAGGGRSGGFRGSRSFSSPARPAQPSKTPDARREAASAAQQPSPMAAQSGGFMRTFGMAMLGGFLGSMLFSGLAHAGLGGFGGSGFGMIEILLLAALAYFLYRRFRTPAAATNFGSMQYGGTEYQAPSGGGYRAPASASVNEPSQPDQDYRSLTLMDPGFAPDQFLKTAQDIFFKVQGAWNRQDVAALKALCGVELTHSWETEISGLRARGQRNKMENIALRQSEITEVWTENGQDYITVRLQAHLLDYTVDVKSGAVVNGSDSEPIEFEEYWTFTRPVGPNAWKLSAVQQAQA
ncbi:MAG TPA: Tim44 domain-containing protein [Candidatus Binatia bacterium]|nr:Tim44 domain-containing protein [Candidatus Binatia bacterium]